MRAADAAAAEHGLPEGWRRSWSTTYSRPYYWHKKTRRQTWTLPTGAPSPDGAEAGRPRPAPASEYPLSAAATPATPPPADVIWQPGAAEARDAGGARRGGTQPGLERHDGAQALRLEQAVRDARDGAPSEPPAHTRSPRSGGAGQMQVPRCDRSAAKHTEQGGGRISLEISAPCSPATFSHNSGKGVCTTRAGWADASKAASQDERRDGGGSAAATPGGGTSSRRELEEFEIEEVHECHECERDHKMLTGHAHTAEAGLPATGCLARGPDHQGAAGGEARETRGDENGHSCLDAHSVPPAPLAALDPAPQQEDGAEDAEDTANNPSCASIRVLQSCGLLFARQGAACTCCIPQGSSPASSGTSACSLQLVVANIQASSAADWSGVIAVGDVLVSVNGEPACSVSLPDDKLIGAQGSLVSLVLERDIGLTQPLRYNTTLWYGKQPPALFSETLALMLEQYEEECELARQLTLDTEALFSEVLDAERTSDIWTSEVRHAEPELGPSHARRTHARVEQQDPSSAPCLADESSRQANEGQETGNGERWIHNDAARHLSHSVTEEGVIGVVQRAGGRGDVASSAASGIEGASTVSNASTECVSASSWIRGRGSQPGDQTSRGTSDERFSIRRTEKQQANGNHQDGKAASPRPQHGRASLVMRLYRWIADVRQSTASELARKRGHGGRTFIEARAPIPPNSPPDNCMVQDKRGTKSCGQEAASKGAGAARGTAPAKYWQ